MTNNTNASAVQATSTHAKGQVILAVCVTLIGIVMAYGTTTLPEATGYAKVGPRLMPALVAIGLIVLGILLLKESLTGGFRGVDESQHQSGSESATDWAAFSWISAGLILNGLLIVHAGFVIAGSLLFVLAARAFKDEGGTRYVKNTLIGFVIAAVTYAFFTYGLGLGLPQGVLPY
jgi:putative tricarboxylic transport membrane protein